MGTYVEESLRFEHKILLLLCLKYHLRPLTLAEICRNMDIWGGFGAREICPGFIIWSNFRCYRFGVTIIQRAILDGAMEKL